MTVVGSFAGAVRRRVQLWCPAVLVWVCGAAVVCGAAEPDVDPAEAAFDAADADQDGVLACEEFESLSVDAKVARRDFRLFDFDRNGSLTWSEFRSIPGSVPLSRRGAIPDPFDHLVAAAVEAVDESIKGLGDERSRSANVVFFLATVVGNVALSPNVMIGNVAGGGGIGGGFGGGGGIGGGGFGGGGLGRGRGQGGAGLVRPDGGLQVQPDWRAQADPDADGVVTRAEQKRFVEIHLGVRSMTGERLRDENGRVVALGQFSRVDANRNLQLERDEFLGHANGEQAQQQFQQIDQDGNGAISLREFSHPGGSGEFDPIEWFLAADRDRDGLLDFIELKQATEESHRVLVRISFPAFDEDRDGNLSLDEYRLSMLGNPIARWEVVPLDANEDDRLSFDEFRFRDAHCELLRLFYFHRFDANSDDTLSREEYPFRSRPPQKLHLLAADGKESRLLFADEKYADVGSPAVSPDGARIAFDGHGRGETLRRQRILMMSIDGTDPEDVCAGLMPTWSKDGTQFACSRYEPRAGIWIVNADGSGERRISDGWAAQWSPDGKSIAFTKNNGLWVYEVESGNFREILSAVDNPYRTIYWNMCWSPDSRRLVFKASKARGCDIASVSMQGGEPDLHVHYSSDRSIKEDPAWSPDGSRIVVALALPQQEHQLLCELDPITDEPPTILKGLDRSLTYEGCCFTPDGKWIIVQTAE